MAGTVVGLARRAASRAPMETLETAEVTAESGVRGDYRGAPGGRQVTVLTRESWQAACAELGRQMPWTTRRANVYIDGLRVEGALGRRIRIGDLELEISAETAPCERMEEAAAGLRRALTPGWRGGVSCTVRSPGRIRLGDAATLDD